MLGLYVKQIPAQSLPPLIAHVGSASLLPEIFSTISSLHDLDETFDFVSYLIHLRSVPRISLLMKMFTRRETEGKTGLTIFPVSLRYST